MNDSTGDIGDLHLNVGQLRFGILRLNLEVGEDIRHDGADDRRGDDRAVDVLHLGLVEDDKHQHLRVVGGGDAHKGSDPAGDLAAFLGVELFAGAGLAADPVAGNIGILARAVGISHHLFEDAAHRLGGLFADDLALDDRFGGRNDVALRVENLTDDIRLHQAASVDRRRDGGADLDGGDLEGLPEGGGGKLLAGFFGEGVVVVENAVRFAGKVDAGRFPEAEPFEVIVEVARPDLGADHHEGGVAGKFDCLGEVNGTVAGGLPAGFAPPRHDMKAGTGVIFPGGAADLGVERHGGGDDLEDRARLIGVADRLVAPLGKLGLAQRVEPFGLEPFGFLAGRSGDLLVKGCNFGDRLGVAEDIRFVGIKIGLGRHPKDGPGIDVHGDSDGAIVDVVFDDRRFKMPFQAVLDHLIDGQHDRIAIHRLIFPVIGIGHVAAFGILGRDNHPGGSGEDLFVVAFDAVGALVFGGGKAEHRRGETAVGVVAPGVLDEVDAVDLVFIAEAENGVGGCVVNLLLDDFIIAGCFLSALYDLLALYPEQRRKKIGDF